MSWSRFLKPTACVAPFTTTAALNLLRSPRPSYVWLFFWEHRANSYEMSSDGASFVVVTGPNMGGKSTYIRALGAVAVMAQVRAFFSDSIAGRLKCLTCEFATLSSIFVVIWHHAFYRWGGMPLKPNSTLISVRSSPFLISCCK